MNVHVKNQLEVGAKLPALTKIITQAKINDYAEASGDFNPIHVDEEFAKQTQFKGTIAHGLLSIAYLSEMMLSLVGENWLSGGELNVTFLSPVKPGDTITISGRVIAKEMSNGVPRLRVSLEAVNQNDNKVIAAEAGVSLN
jgi:3-hydroxybutyryl-CoA dehydratase